ncbi:hypothetical protein [Bradyrhizobium sp. BR 1432]|uniref:hypothetical protein n=1 Tax=Bradyrhizobium sp. BR 1432 TaxID=3447966 RepID=UPI003EE4FA98
MSRKTELEAGVEPLDNIIVGELPSDVFVRRFSSYFFYDIDLNSSEAIISALRQVAVVCSGLDFEIDVYASSTRRFLASLDEASNLPCEIKKLGRAMCDDGDMGGMSIVDRRKRWAIYQERPIDLAVLAVECDVDLRGIAAVRDCFFTIGDVRNWLSMRTARDRELVDVLGSGFLSALVESYSSPQVEDDR